MTSNQEVHYIDCRPIHNAKCLQCGAVEEKMMSVGALVFCVGCFWAVFNCDRFSTKSAMYQETYLQFLEKWKKLPA